MDDREGGEREPGISVLIVWHDDEDDDEDLYPNGWRHGEWNPAAELKIRVG